MPLIQGDPCHCGLLLRVNIYRGQVINGVLAQVHLLLGTLCPQDPPLVISPFPECILEKFT